MGFMSPSTPGPDPALKKARLEEEARLEAEKKAEASRKAESERKRRANLVGQRSLQEEDIVGFQGFRTSKSMGKSIRS